MGQQPGTEAPAGGAALVVAVTLIAVIAALLDLFALLLLPLRVGGQLLPVGPVLVLVVNASLGYVGLRVLQSRLPAQVVLGVAVLVATSAAGRGPGGDLLDTRNLQTVYLAFVLLAAVGAAVPLFLRRPRPSAPRPAPPPSSGA